MKNTDQLVRVAFASSAALLSAWFGYGYHHVHYHNAVWHYHSVLPALTGWVSAVAPWVFALPFAILLGGLIWWRRPIVVLSLVNVGWLFAIAWPALCLWAWAIPQELL